MKKILLFLLLAGCMLPVMGQLNVMEEGAEKRLYDAGDVKVVYANSQYQLQCKNYRSAEYIALNLGEEWSNAQTSIRQLKTWFNQHKKKDYLIIDQDGIQITLYKASPTLLMVAYASPAECEATYRGVIEFFLVDPLFAIGLVENSEIMGLLSSTRLNQVYKYITRNKKR